MPDVKISNDPSASPLVSTAIIPIVQDGTNKKTTVADIVAGSEKLHGIETAGALSFDNSTHILSIASGTNTYWYQGTKYTTSSAITCDLDSFVTLTANTLYFVYFEDTTGTLKASATAWNLLTKVPVATVFWNGSAGAVGTETHSHTRDLDWHRNAHTTIGARISAGDFAITAPSVASPTTVDFAGGTLWDEDIANTIGQQTNCRVWYQTGASTYTFTDSNSIYPAAVSFVNSSGYALTSVGNSAYINMWVYASNDISRPIYAFVETAAAAYTTAANARAVTPPNLSAYGLTQEMKLLYRVILKGDETFVESTDYRASASLPAGGTTTPSASSVTFIASGNIAATNVQAAIEELDTEKQAILVSGTNIKTINSNSLLGSGDLAVTGGMTAESKTSSFNAANNYRYIVSTAGGAVTATLPASPSVGDYIEFVDAGSTWTATDFTIARNSLKINGATADFICDTDNVQVSLTYTGASYGWAVKIGASVLTAAAHSTSSHSDWPAAVSMTEVGYLDGVTSAIQTQLGGKAATDQTFYIGTTQVAINRASAALTLAGITLTTPDIGVATATSVNKLTITAPATGSTLAVADGKTLTCSNTITLTGTDSTSYNLNALTSVPQNTQSDNYTLVIGAA